jgi:hypothetical protein
MPRQPLLPAFRDAKLRFPSDALAERPEIAKLIGQCVGLWGQIEVQLALVLYALKDSPKSNAAVTFFLSIRNSRLQREGLAAVASNTALSGDNSDLFGAISVVYQSLERQRNDLVHGVYVLADNLPDDALLWTEPSKHAIFFAEIFDKIAKGEPFSELDDIKKDTFIYRPKDIEALRDQMRELWLATMIFAQQLRFPGGLLSTVQRERLNDLPHIGQELRRLKSDRESSDTKA